MDRRLENGDQGELTTDCRRQTAVGGRLAGFVAGLVVVMLLVGCVPAGLDAGLEAEVVAETLPPPTATAGETPLPPPVVIAPT